MIVMNYGSSSRNEEYIKNYPTDYDIVRRFVNIESPVLFDVGAHHGETIKEMCEYFDNPIIHAFEPAPLNYDFLKNTYSSLPNVHLNNLGVSDSSGISQFFVNKLSHTNSFLRVNADSKDHIKLKNLNDNEKNKVLSEEYNQEVVVNITKIDDYCEQHDIKQIDFLKIDTQGFEIACLKGCQRMLANTKILKCELSLFDYYDCSSSFYEIEEILRPYNFKLYSIPFVSQNPENGRTDWIDVIYIKDKII